MSYAAQRAVPTTRGRLLDLTGSVPGLALTAVLGSLAVLLVVRFVQQATAVPLSWERPPVEALFLLPAAPVLGLLGLRLVIGGRRRSLAGQHLVSMAARWAGVWAAATAVWTLLTVAGLYDLGSGPLVVPDNLAAVMGSSDIVVAQLSVLWVSLLIALFAPRLGGWRETSGLLALGAAALLSAVPVSVAHGHDEAAQPLITGLAALEVVGLALWLGALAALLHLRTPLYQLRHHLTRSGALLSASGLLLGFAAVLANLLLPADGGATPPVLATAQLTAVVLIAAVGYRHRRRSVELGAGRGRSLVALVAGEVVVLGAIVMVAAVLPVGG